MTEYELTADDQVWLAEVGVADAPVVNLASNWVAERVLQAAAAGVLTGPNLDGLTDQEQPVVRLGDRPVSGVEAEAMSDMAAWGLVVWVGCRITATAAGRERLVLWAQRRSQLRRKGGDRP